MIAPPLVDVSHLSPSRLRPREHGLTCTITTLPATVYYCEHCGCRLRRSNTGTACAPCEERIELERYRNPRLVAEGDAPGYVLEVVVEHFGCVSALECIIETNGLANRLYQDRGITGRMAGRINGAILEACASMVAWKERGEMRTR